MQMLKQLGIISTFLLLCSPAYCQQPASVSETRQANPHEFDALDPHYLRTPYKDNLSEDEKIAGLSKMWAEVRYNFANFDLVPGLDWDSLYLACLPRVRQTKSTLEYYKILMELCARLKDGHTNVYVPDKLMSEVYSRPPIRTALIEDKVIVTKVASQTLTNEGIKPGLEVVAIDNIPVKKYAEEYVAPYQCTSTRQDLEVRSYIYALLSGSKDKDIELTLADDKGLTFSKSVHRKAYKDAASIAPPSFAYRVLQGNIGYVELNSFEDPGVTAQFDSAFADISKTEALILDLRQNGGGMGNIGLKILSYLTDRKFKASRSKTRQYIPTFRAWEMGGSWFSMDSEERNPNGNNLYTKPVVVLTSARTFSAAEDFCVAFDFMKRGIIIGEPTGGSTGQPLLLGLPGGGTLRICTKRDTYPDGKEFVGVGIQPNIIVHQTVSDFRNGTDTVLNRALDELKKSMIQK